MTSPEDEMPSPSSVSAYLRSVGWSPIDAGAAWARWRLMMDGDEVILTVPLRGHAPDYRRRFMELVDDLRRLEDRTAEQIVRDIRSSGSDVIRIRLLTPAGSPSNRARVPFSTVVTCSWRPVCAAVDKRPIADFELIGPVHKLTSTAPVHGGEIIVAMTEPWPGRKVRVALTGPAYQQAAQAHTAGLWISCEGELVRQGDDTTLINPRNLNVLAII